jgi:hypothetical protein
MLYQYRVLRLMAPIICAFLLQPSMPNMDERAQKNQKCIGKCVLKFHDASISGRGGSIL